MAFAYQPLDLLLLLSLTCFSSTSIISSVKPRRLVSKLIHPGSVRHFHYKPNETAKD
ncbi:hypothetical protein AAZX31_15G156700 [Glycine max]|nr:hypothetical protein GLYMA_15G164550v4 [Glycine max]KAH1147471.1 hypothetical protein GYH30_042576 [Glycine max]